MTALTKRGPVDLIASFRSDSDHVPGSMKTRLSVNLNKVALLRNQRDLIYPSVTDIARLVIGAGADGITVHPRPDERHTRPADVRDLGLLFSSEFEDDVEFNIEGYPTGEFLELVSEVKPTQVTLVPDAPDQRTSDHGWDLSADGEWLKEVVSSVSVAGSRVSLFVDPDVNTILRARDTGAQRVELYTERYANAFATSDYEGELDRYAEAAEAATENGLGVNAGHDLTLESLPAFLRRIPAVAEVSIGHAITSDALLVGFPAAVKSYLDAVRTDP